MLRTFLRGATPMALSLSLVLAAPTAAQELPSVQPVNLSRLAPADFADEELYLPYYLSHLHRVANAVRTSGEDHGFIDISVWRSAEDNRPYNARVMESILSLAFFYSTDRPWNPYRGDPALRARLEAALDFWVRSQSPQGTFSEYAAQRWSLAPTAFGTKFMGEALQLLRAGPPLDSALMRRVSDAQRKAIEAVLTDPDLYEHGKRFSNQYSNVWAGALAYLDLYPDPELARRVGAAVARARSDHQSPAGYYYEADGPDWGYNLNTHHSNLQMAWHYARGTPLADAFEEETRRWYEWFAYNAVPEPEGWGFTLNRAIETRQQKPFVRESGPEESEVGFPLAETMELARLLSPTRQELASRAAARRDALERTWPRMDPLPVGDFRAFSPYAFLHRGHAQWHPTEQQRRAALSVLPQVAREHFTHQRTDTRRPVVFTYVRRPGYYAAFNAGEIIREQQRYGLGLLWVPGAGSFLQSQTGTTDAAWGTRAADGEEVYEALSFTPVFRVDGSVVEAEPGNRDLPGAVLEAEYRLGERGRKTVEFAEDAIRVGIRHPGSFVEQVPLLLLLTDEVREETGLVEVRRGDVRLVLRFDRATRARVEPTELRTGEKRVVVVALAGEEALEYTLQVHR